MHVTKQLWELCEFMSNWLCGNPTTLTNEKYIISQNCYQFLNFRGQIKVIVEDTSVDKSEASGGEGSSVCEDHQVDLRRKVRKHSHYQY